MRLVVRGFKPLKPSRARGDDGSFMTGNPPASLEETPPSSDAITAYDRKHITLYLRLLDADAAGATLQEVAPLVLGIDAGREPERAQRVHDAHLSRARWLSMRGYLQLLGNRFKT